MYPEEEFMLACSSFLVYLFIYLVFFINQSFNQCWLFFNLRMHYAKLKNWAKITAEKIIFIILDSSYL